MLSPLIELVRHVGEPVTKAWEELRANVDEPQKTLSQRTHALTHTADTLSCRIEYTCESALVSKLLSCTCGLAEEITGSFGNLQHPLLPRREDGIDEVPHGCLEALPELIRTPVVEVGKPVVHILHAVIPLLESIHRCERRHADAREDTRQGECTRCNGNERRAEGEDVASQGQHRSGDCRDDRPQLDNLRKVLIKVFREVREFLREIPGSASTRQSRQGGENLSRSGFINLRGDKYVPGASKCRQLHASAPGIRVCVDSHITVVVQFVQLMLRMGGIEVYLRVQDMFIAEERIILEVVHVERILETLNGGAVRELFTGTLKTFQALT